MTSHRNSSPAASATVGDSPHGPPPFAWSHLWKPAIVNPVNLKSYTIPIFNLTDPYAQAFHLSWLGFFVAFLSWFAFPPLTPEAIKDDLKLSANEVSNSSIIALTATLVVRFFVGPFVDRYGPRKVMAAILLLGAIPSGLAGTAHDAATLYVLRFFIGILGSTFVPCQAWTSAFFDKNVVGTANALVGGWGNMGGGATFAIMVSLYQSLRHRGLSEHVAWRAAFAIVPAPVLIFVAVLTLVIGKDHPAGKWSERHNLPATVLAAQQGHHVHQDADEKKIDLENNFGSKDVEVTARAVDEHDTDITTVDVAINESLTLQAALEIVASPVTWLPAISYLTTFGFELLVDGQMAAILFALFNKKIPGFGQTTAGYYTSIFGFLNLVTRPFGGYVGDVVYRRWGTKGKKYWVLACGVIMGATSLAGGFYLVDNKPPKVADLPTVIGIFAVSIIFSELGNGANFALVPHCNPYNNGVMSGIVGSFGSLGGVIFTIIFRFQTAQGKGFWIVGVICIILNVLMIPISVPK